MKLKNKIEELKKNLVCPNCNYASFDIRVNAEFDKFEKEAQKLMDETLKNIIDEIDDLDIREILNWKELELKRYKPQIPQVKANKIKHKIKQIIQKQFNSQESQSGSKTSDNTTSEKKLSLSSDSDTSILDDFCEELKEELIRWKNEGHGQPCCMEICQKGVFIKIDKLKKKHGGKE